MYSSFLEEALLGDTSGNKRHFRNRRFWLPLPGDFSCAISRVVVFEREKESSDCADYLTCPKETRTHLRHPPIAVLAEADQSPKAKIPYYVSDPENSLCGKRSRFSRTMRKHAKGIRIALEASFAHTWVIPFVVYLGLVTTRA